MTLLRPITKKTPASTSTIEETGLPFGFVLQPFHNKDIVTAGTKPNNASSSENTTSYYYTSSRPNSPTKRITNKTASKLQPTKACLIAKCTNCGSPLNPTSPFISSWSVLCNFCGQTFDVDYETQHEMRQKALSSKSGRNSRSVSNSNNNNNNNNRSSNNDRKIEYKNRYTRNQNLPECKKSKIEYSLPLLSVPMPESNNSHHNEIYTLPAKMCPPLITILIDGTTTNANYYNEICTSLDILLQICDDDNHNNNSNNKKHDDLFFKGCRIGIFIMTKHGGLSIFDLKHSGSHIKHLQIHSSPSLQQRQQKQDARTVDTENDNYYNEPNKHVISLSEMLDIEHIYVPLDNAYTRSNVESAIRTLGDCDILNQACNRDYNDPGTGDNGTGGGVYLGSTIEYILDFIEDVGYHPGIGSHDPCFEKHNKDAAIHKFLYAGGKILCFLAGPPHEIGFLQPSQPQGRTGMGGFGGTCAEIGKRFGNTNHNVTMSHESNEKHLDNDDDIEAGGVHNNNTPKMNRNGKTGTANIEEGSGSSSKTNKNHKTRMNDEMNFQATTAFKNVDEYYQHLGIQCAYDAFSIEIFGLIDESSSSRDDISGLFIGIPYLRLLSDRSGGSGPLLITLSNRRKCTNNNNDANEEKLLVREVISRCTLTRPTAFGALLRIRLSPSLSINMDREEHVVIDRNSKIKQNTRLFNYYCSSGMYGSVSPSSSDPELFFMGSCDVSTTLSFELKITSNSNSIDDYVFVDGRGGDMQLTPCVQTCFAYTSIVYRDGDWRTVRRLRVCTTKLNLTDITESITSSLDLEALAVNRFHSLYASSLRGGIRNVRPIAQNWLLNVLLSTYKSADEQYKVMQKYGYNGGHVVESFYPSDRLLNVSGGQLSNKEKLLAQGHSQLQMLPLLIFSLIQCDALRPRRDSFEPSIDSRSAASANMGNMSPSSISRCISPRLELWISGLGNKGPSFDSVGTSMDDIRFAVIDQVGLHEKTEEAPDASTPRPLLLLDSPRQVLIYDCYEFCRLQSGIKDEDVPMDLKISAKMAKQSYRVPPLVKSSAGSKDIQLADADSHLKDALIEDSRLSETNQTYKEWLNLLAEVLFSEISKKE